MSLARFEEMLKTNSVYFFDAVEFEDIIHHYLDNGNTSLAKKAITLAMEQHPSSITIKLIHVEILIFEDKFQEAEQILEQLKEIEPSNDEVFVQIANLYSKKDKHQIAIQYLYKALELTDDIADISSLLGMEYLYIDNYQKARESFEKSLAHDLEDYASLYNVIYCYDMESMHKEAIDFLNRYIDRNPYCEVAWHQIGRQYYTIKDYKNALKSFDYAVLIDEAFIGGYLEKAKTLEKLERYEEAIKNYQLTQELEDPTAYAYLRIGECYKNLKEYHKASIHYKKAVHEDPLLDKGWMALAYVTNIEKKYDRALHYVNKAIALDEINTTYWRYNAEINLRLGFYEEAIQAFEKCIEFDDSGVEVWITMTDVMVFIGEIEIALNKLIQAKKQHGNVADIEYRLACLFHMIHKRKEAFLHLKNALHLDFEYHLVIKDLFPSVFDDMEINNIIENFSIE